MTFKAINGKCQIRLASLQWNDGCIQEKLDWLEGKMAHMEKHVHCDFRPLTSPYSRPENPTPVNSSDSYGLGMYFDSSSLLVICSFLFMVSQVFTIVCNTFW